MNIEEKNEAKVERKIKEMAQGKEAAQILEMPMRPRFSSGEINSLFLGLCRLVHRTAMEEAQEQLGRKFKRTEEQLLAEIKNLKMINKGLTEELQQVKKA